MNPYPFVGLNHFTVPVAISFSNADRARYRPGASTTRIANRSPQRQRCQYCQFVPAVLNNARAETDMSVDRTTQQSIFRPSVKRSPPLGCIRAIFGPINQDPRWRWSFTAAGNAAVRQ